MKIEKPESDKMHAFKVMLTFEELNLVIDMIGNTYSGGDTWRVSREDFTKKFGITYDKARELSETFDEFRSRNEPSVMITIRREDLEAITRMTIRLLELWSEAEFSTLIATEKEKAKLLVKQFNQWML